jgi:hypothetical protein
VFPEACAVQWRNDFRYATFSRFYRTICFVLCGVLLRVLVPGKVLVRPASPADNGDKPGLALLLTLVPVSVPVPR